MNALQFAGWLPDLLEGLKITMAASLISIVTSTVLGAVVAIFVAYDNKIVTGILRVFVSIFRNTPLLVIMFFIFYGLPLINVVWPPLLCGILAITLNESAFVAEILRGSILNIPQGDIEAAVSLGLKKWQVSSKIIFPLAMRNSVPMLVGQSSVIVKDTSLFSLIMIFDLMRASQAYYDKYLSSVSIWIVGVIYVLIFLALSWLGARLEQKASFKR